VLEKSALTPVEMREKIKAAGVQIPTGKELKKYSDMFNARLDKVVPATESQTWFKMFKDFDVDASGILQYEEIENGVRERLRFKQHELSDLELKAVWLAIDKDESGYIESGEFHQFLGRPHVEKGLLEKRQEIMRQKSKQKREQLESHQAHEIAAEGFLSTSNTKEMREELRKQGVEPWDEEEREIMAKMFAGWVKEYMPDRHEGIAWLLIFKEIDDDASGILTYDELRLVIRRKFKIKATEFSEEDIKEVWCNVDEDDSNSIALVEFGRFSSSRT